MAFLRAYRNQQVSTPESDVIRLAGYRQSLANRSSDAVVIIDANGTIQFVNDAALSMHNYDRKDALIGKNVSIFYSKKAADDTNRFIAQAKLLGWYIANVSHLRSDNSVFAVQIKMVSLKDESGKFSGIIMIIADMSRLAALQKMIEKSNIEIEAIKGRLALLENPDAPRVNRPPIIQQEIIRKELSNTNQLLPVNELKHLAEMAKKFR